MIEAVDPTLHAKEMYSLRILAEKKDAGFRSILYDEYVES